MTGWNNSCLETHQLIESLSRANRLGYSAKPVRQQRRTDGTWDRFVEAYYGSSVCQSICRKQAVVACWLVDLFVRLLSLGRYIHGTTT
jgi:hypothetical protein